MTIVSGPDDIYHDDSGRMSVVFALRIGGRKYTKAVGKLFPREKLRKIVHKYRQGNSDFSGDICLYPPSRSLPTLTRLACIPVRSHPVVIKIINELRGTFRYHSASSSASSHARGERRNRFHSGRRNCTPGAARVREEQPYEAAVEFLVRAPFIFFSDWHENLNIAGD